jgi:hypothetical protein
VLSAITVTVGVLAGCGSGGGSTGGTTASSGAQRKGPAGPPAVAAKVKAFKIGGDPWSVAAVDDVVWVASRGDGRLVRISRSGARLGRPTRLGHLGTLVNALAVSAGGTWVGYAKNAGYVVRLDPASGALGQRVSVGIDAKHIAIGGGAAYASYLTNIARVPLGGGPRRAVDVGRTPNALLYVAGRLWASAWNGRTRSGGVVLELNPRSLRTASEIPATDPADRSSTSEESEPFGLAAGARSVWAAVAGDLGEVIRIDQRSGRETARIPVGTSYPFAVAFAEGNLCLTTSTTRSRASTRAPTE